MIRQQSFQNKKASLYVVATPIGNLNEVSKRLIDAIEDSAVVFCEDTRVSGNLLNLLNIHKPLISSHENIERSNVEKALSYLNNNENVSLLSDAGYPAISDPGSIIIQEVIKNNFNVVVINGPSALMQSAVASGFDLSHFYFHGFLNAKESLRKKELETLKNIDCPIIFYQSPHKIKNCLEDMLSILGNRNICLCRELTKKFEEYIRGTISEVLEICETLKGEMVVVVDSLQKEKKEIDEKMIDEVNRCINEGMKTNEAIKKIAKENNVSKNELYEFYLLKEKK